MHISGHLAPAVTCKYNAILTSPPHVILLEKNIIMIVNIIIVIIIMMMMIEGKQGNSWLHVITLGIIHQ